MACARSDLKLLEVETAAAMHEQETQSKTVADENRKLSEVLQLQKATCESLERRNVSLRAHFNHYGVIQLICIYRGLLQTRWNANMHVVWQLRRL